MGVYGTCIVPGEEWWPLCLIALIYLYNSWAVLPLTFMNLADTFIQSDLQLHSGYTFSSVCVFPGNRTHNLLRC